MSKLFATAMDATRTLAPQRPDAWNLLQPARRSQRGAEDEKVSATPASTWNRTTRVPPTSACSAVESMRREKKILDTWAFDQAVAARELAGASKNAIREPARETASAEGFPIDPFGSPLPYTQQRTAVRPPGRPHPRPSSVCDRSHRKESKPWIRRSGNVPCARARSQVALRGPSTGSNAAWCPTGRRASGIRRLVKSRLCELQSGDPAATPSARSASSRTCRRAALALPPEKANEQHYELPADFFGAVLGPQRKYSSCLLARGRRRRLAQAEAAALQLTCERAGLADGQHVLELGCGWGSLTLWMARALSAQPHHRAVELALAARLHRGARPSAAGLANVRVDHLRHQRLRHRQSASIASCRSRCSSTCATGRARSRAWRAGSRPDGRFFMHVFVAPRGALRVRRARCERLDEPALLLRRHDAERRSGAALPGRSAPR